MNYILGSSFYNARMASTQPRNSTSTVQLPASLLEVFVPGYSTMSGLLFEAFGFDMTLIVSLAFLVYALVRSIDFLRDQTLLFITRFGTCSVSMDSDSDSYFWMVGWLADHGVGEASYSLMALPKSHAKSWQVMPDNSIEIHTGNVPRAPPSASGKVGDSVRYEPSLGLSQYFWHKNRLFLWHRQRQKKAPETGYDLLEGTSSRIEARIYCLSRSTSPIKALIEESAEHYRRKSAARTSIRRPAPSKKRREGMYPWIKVASRPSRAMDTVVLDQTEKERVIADIEAYLEPSARFWYASRGIPYRRGYLFYGPAGTGKSSLSFAIAGLFDLNVFCISLQEPTITEEDLFALFDELPEKCLVLLEDIDSAGLVVRNNPEVQNSDHATRQAVDSRLEDDSVLALANNGHDVHKPSISSTRISLSGLLNTIDGIASQEGRVLIMTTNHIENLDSALLRPGRIDLRIRFELATKKQVEDLFVQIFTAFTVALAHDSSEKVGSVNKELSMVTKPRKGVAMPNNDEIRRMAKAFAAEIPEKTLSPAEIQGFLITRKQRPADAVAEVSEWLASRKNR